MSRCVRLLFSAVAINICLGGVAAGQTVLVKGASPGDAVEIVVNGAKVGEGTVGGDRIGTAVGKLPANDANRPEMDARVYVDACPKRQRVQIVERNRQPEAREEGCDRREIGGVFWIRQRSTVVIDVAGPIPTLLLRQGDYDPNAVNVGRQAPRGLVLFVGGGWGTYGDLTDAACGNVGGCEGKGSGGAWTAGADFWLTRFLAIEASYLKPHKADYDASGVNFRFSHFFDAELFTVGGKLAAPLGPVRLYGRGGGAFHRAVSSTTQTNDPLTFTGTDGQTHTTPGGTQTFETRTEGWSWMLGGGIEGWVSPRVALYGDATYAKLKGEPTSGTDLPIDGHAMQAVVGVRFKVF